MPAVTASASDVEATTVDVAVVGAGFGGLSATLTLAERGLRVLCLEALPYGGGCASTYTRHGVRYESGATLFSGLAPATPTHAGGFFTRALQRHGLHVDVDFLDPVISHTSGDGVMVHGYADRARFVDELVALSPAHKADNVRAFFDQQQQLAELLWPLLDDDRAIPAFTATGLWHALPRQLPRLTSYLARAPLLWSLRNTSLLGLLQRHGVDDVPAVRSWVRSLCQISLQTDIDDADAVFACCVLDYLWRGTGHVRGGIGVLVDALIAAIRHAGGDVHLARRVRQVERDGSGFLLDTARGPVRARQLVLNLLPVDAARLLGEPLSSSQQVSQARVDDGWSAVLLYAVLRAPPGADSAAHHIDVQRDATAPVFDGHHAFVSLSAANEGRFNDEEHAALGGGDLRTATVSTHVKLSTWAGLDDAARAAETSRIQQRLTIQLAVALPEWTVLRVLPASPRTFARYTGRHAGAVGGPARTVQRPWLQGASSAVSLVDNAYLVGDSGFPGQSALAVAVGGARTAHHIADRW
jgi:phytoene dehydrogenase-like protein